MAEPGPDEPIALEDTAPWPVRPPTPPIQIHTSPGKLGIAMVEANKLRSRCAELQRECNRLGRRAKKANRRAELRKREAKQWYLAVIEAARDGWVHESVEIRPDGTVRVSHVAR